MNTLTKKNLMKRPSPATYMLLLAFLSFFNMPLLQAAPSAAPEISGELRTWHKITLTFDGPVSRENASPNPFLDYRMDVTFTSGNTTYIVPGYYAADGNAASTSLDNGNKWRVHFAPDKEGAWTYKVSFRKGANVAVDNNRLAGNSAGYFDGASGSLNISATNKTSKDNRGKGRLQYVGEHFLRYAGTGEYFVKGGADAPENFLSYADFDGDFKTDGIKDELVKTWSAHVSDWRTGDPTWKGGKGKGMIGALNYLSTKGINAFSFLTLNINGDDRNVYPYTSYNERLRFDCSKLDQWEIIFEHADKLGLYLHFKLQEEENERLLDDGNVGIQRKLYYRELIARFSHHLAMNWNFGEENGPTVNAQTDTQRKAMGQYFSQHDPYHHLKVLHTRPGQQETVYAPLLGNGQYLDGTSLQVMYNKVHEETLKWIKRSVSAGHKWVVANDEQGDSSTGVTPDGADNNHDAIRKYTLWGNLMAGGAGVEYYFGYKYAHSDLTCQDWRSRNNMWNYTNYALTFFREHIPFWEMSNANALLTSNNGYCLTQAGQVYVVYLTNGGGAKLNLAGVNKTFAATWYNPRDGKFDAQNSSIQGGAEVTLGNPPRDTQQDWVILLKVSSETNVSPTIALTAPANNATYTAGNDITINATANDQDGSVAKVAFYNGSTRLGEDTTAPYAFTWKGASAGVHQIKAVATDNQGSEAFASATITVADGSNCPTTFVEQNGLVVIETESVSSMPGGWTKKTSTSGYTGSGYLEWTGSDNFSTPGVGTMTYKFQITKTGTYRFVWRNLIAKGSSSTDYNDTWLKFPDASDFYGKRDTHIVYPKGSGKSPNPNGAGAGGWFKIYTNAKGWNWQTTTSDNDPHHIYAKFDAPGIYSLQISGRSNGHAIDRLVLHHADVSNSLATQTSNPETRCSTAPAPSNIPPTVSITSPANNTVVELGSKVVVSAQAADQDGQIQVVKFYQWAALRGQTLITQDTSAPYSFELTNTQAGDYIIKAVAVDNQGAATTSSPVTISFKEPVSQPVTPAAISLTLVNAVTDQPIAGYDPLAEGAVINLAKVGKDLAIVANISGIDGAVPAGMPPSSVKFSYNGNDAYQIENKTPYAIAGDNSGDYNSWTPSLGNNQVTATAYSGSRATGEVLAKISISFQVVEQTITLPPAPITFTLYDAVTDQPVAGYDPIAEGAVINLAKVGKDLNIVAKVNGITSVASIKFGYNGNSSYHTENFAPYAIGMDDSGNLRSWTPALGNNQLSATAYSGSRATGDVLAKASMSFQVIDNASLVNARTAGLPADKANSQNSSLPTDKAPYSISTYPNPAVDEITVAVNTVAVNTENFMAGTYTISNIQGRVVAQGVLPRTADGANQTTIGVRNLKRGIYFMHIYVYGEHSSAPGHRAVEKIIIDK